MNVKNKRMKINEIIVQLEKLKTLYTDEYDSRVIHLKASLRRNVKVILDKSELLFKNKTEKALYDMYMHFGILNVFTRKEAKEYLLNKFNILENSTNSYIQSLEYHKKIRNISYGNLKIQLENEYKYNYRINYHPRIDNIKKKYIKDDKSDQLVISEFGILKLINNNNLEVRSEDAARFAKIYLEGEI